MKNSNSVLHHSCRDGSWKRLFWSAVRQPAPNSNVFSSKLIAQPHLRSKVGACKLLDTFLPRRLISVLPASGGCGIARATASPGRLAPEFAQFGLET